MTEVQVSETSVVSGLLDFVAKDVVPREEAIAGVLESAAAVPGRRLGSADGRAGAQGSTRPAASAGYYQMFCPESIGGGGLPMRLSVLCWEALHHEYGPGERLMYGTISHWASGPSALWTEVNDHLATNVRPKVVGGRVAGCFGMSEPQAGSDAWGMQTRAVRDGDTWNISGTKQWTSFAHSADYILLFAVTDPGLVEQRRGGVTAFYVPMDTEGVRLESVIPMFDEIGGREAIISFDNVRVPDEQRFGPLDQGFTLAMQGASQGRLYNAGRCIGLARWALERSVEYANSRHAGGKAIAEHQAVQHSAAAALGACRSSLRAR
ncbi:MAG: acyl-CoA dehydrogenase family protein [Dehalococcoidia bacterium]|nr:acyl-CoA dehydrogenase family protein [Dehalococcoidia bacterium]